MYQVYISPYFITKGLGSEYSLQKDYSEPEDTYYTDPGKKTCTCPVGRIQKAECKHLRLVREVEKHLTLRLKP